MPPCKPRNQQPLRGSSKYIRRIEGMWRLSSSGPHEENGIPHQSDDFILQGESAFLLITARSLPVAIFDVLIAGGGLFRFFFL